MVKYKWQSYIFGNSKLILGRAFSLGLMVVLLAFRAWDPIPLENFRLRTFDLYQYLSPRPKEPAPVLIVDIDERSLKAIGQWPWPRTILAELIDRIGASGGIAAAFDIIFAEPDRLSPGTISKNLKYIPEETRRFLESLPSNDDVLASSFSRLKVVVAQSALNSRDPASIVTSPDSPSIAIRGPDPRKFLIGYNSILTNIPELEHRAAGRGLFTIRPDSDGIIRRVAVVMNAAGKIRPALSIELLRVASGNDALLLNSNELGMVAIGVGGARIPTDANGRFWMYFNRHDPARFVSAQDVLSGAIGADRLRGKVVFIGTSATGLLDIKATPLDPAMAGVEIQAQLVENIVSGHYLTRPAYFVGAEVVLSFLIALTIIILVPLLGAMAVLVIGFLMALAVISGSFYLFKVDGLLLDPVYPLLSSFAVFWSLVFLNYFQEQSRRQMIRSAFSQYISPVLVEQLARNPERLKLGGETKELTILFSDVRDFTRLAEGFKSNPQGLIRLVNRLLTPLSSTIVRHKGTIDKYMGDNVMAFWNAPLEDANHVNNACRAAINMIREVEALNAEMRREAKEEGHEVGDLSIGIGINTGECVVGNMGSDFRFDYTVLGDSVNLASRLEGQSKLYKIPIILGARTNALASASYHTIPVDFIRVKGRALPERIYGLIRKRNKVRPALDQLEATFAKMLLAYRDQKWDVVIELLDLPTKELEAYNLLGLVELYRERARQFKISPPPPDWDGVYTATFK